MLDRGTYLKEGRYSVLDPLGSGGFGVTYLAEDTKYGIKVAIKEFSPDDGNSYDAYLNKFIKEAQILKSLHHPGIVSVRDVFSENGTAYYVMTYIAGTTLESLVEKNGPLSESTALSYIRIVSSALKYVHSNNILHLDIKPSNIMLDDNGLYLIDFGISKHYDLHGSQTSMTPGGISKGYTPIEQYGYNAVTSFTPASDIYSLAATLYFLLSGITPPEAPLLIDSPLPDISGISYRTMSAIRRAMSPKVKNRPRTIDEFLQSIDVTITRHGSDVPLWRPWKRILRTAFISLLCMLLAGGVTYSVRALLDSARFTPEAIIICDDDDIDSYRISSVEILLDGQSSGETVMQKGRKANLTVMCCTETGKQYRISNPSLFSDAPSVASVDKNGVITAKSTGNTEIRICIGTENNYRFFKKIKVTVE